MNYIVTTEGVPEDLRMDYWQQVIRENFIDFDMRHIAEQSTFNGKIVQYTRNAIQLAHVIADGHFVRRTLQHLAPGNDDFFLLLIQRHGISQIEQDGRQVTMRAGDMVLCDSSRAYSMSMPGMFHHEVLMIPGCALRHSLKNVSNYTARAIPSATGAGHLFREFVRLLQGSVDEFDERSSSPVASATVELLCAALVGVSKQDAPIPGNLKSFHLQRIRAYVLKHLADQDLGVKQISKALQLSMRHLHGICDDQPNTLVNWIWKERLDAARHSLSNPANGQISITEIALSVGFKSSAHFSRRFHSAFQMSPRDFRGQVLKGVNEIVEAESAEKKIVGRFL